MDGAPSIEGARSSEAKQWKSMGVPINTAGKTIKVKESYTPPKINRPKAPRVPGRSIGRR